jgi:hypothetical protein
MFLVCGCTSSGDEPIRAASDCIDVNFNLTSITVERDTAVTRSDIMRDPLYENVIKSLFVMQFDPDGILMYVSPKLEVFYGSETAITNHTESGMYSASNCTIYVMVNFTQAQYRAIKQAANLKQLATMKIELDTFKENGDEEAEGDDEGISLYMPMLGLYSGTVNNAMPLNISLGRYMARVSVRLKKDESNTSTYRNIKISFINSPRHLDVLQPETASDYTPLTSADVFTQEEMTDATTIDNMDNTTFTDTNTRHFYLGENLSDSESGFQTMIHIEGERDGVSVSGNYPLTSTGYINRNTNYEFRLNFVAKSQLKDRKHINVSDALCNSQEVIICNL